jgi:hypothetical protein
VEDKWTSKVPGGRSVTYTYQPILDGRASATAEIEGSNTLYVRDNVPDGMSRGQVEILFELISMERHRVTPLGLIGNSRLRLA